jgi:hypothetical protein
VSLRPSRRLSGPWVLAGFALGGAAAYLLIQLTVTLALGEELPLLGWVGFGVVAVVVSAAAGALALFLVRSARVAGAEATGHAAWHGGTETRRRVLVVADAGCRGSALCEALVSPEADPPSEVFVTAPALVSPLRYLDSDLDEARTAAQRRLHETLDALAAAGVSAEGSVGSESPLEAVADALAVFPADEIVVATGAGPGNWLEQDLAERARAVHGLPVSTLVLGAPLPV